MKRALPFIIVLAVAVIAVGSGVFLYQKKHFASAGPSRTKAEPEAPGQIVHTLGPENAPVTLEEFGDFQCPPCGKLSEPINQLQKQHNLRVIYRNFPLAIHAHAKEAAYAAEAAASRENSGRCMTSFTASSSFGAKPRTCALSSMLTLE